MRITKWLLAMMVLPSALLGCHPVAKNTEDTLQSHAAGYNVTLGLSYLQTGDTVRAKRKLLKALQEAPTSPEANAAMGYFLEQTGDTLEAKQYYERALRLAPTSGAQCNNYGTFLCRQGRYALAEQYFLKAARDVHYLKTAAAYENAGLCALAIPAYAKATFYFSKALKQDPHRTTALIEWVKVDIQQKAYRNALTHLQQHPMLLSKNEQLLELAVRAAKALGDTDLVTEYQNRIHERE